MASERVKVLVTVLAAPQPSAAYGDTVCVAGLRIDRDPVEWVRLYPVPYRFLDGDKRFHKYEIVEAMVSPSTSDARRESRRLVVESINRLQRLDPWKPSYPIPTRQSARCPTSQTVTFDIFPQTVVQLAPR